MYLSSALGLLFEVRGPDVKLHNHTTSQLRLMYSLALRRGTDGLQ